MKKLSELYMAPVPPVVKRVLMIIKAGLTAAASAAYMNDNPTVAMWTLVLLGVINEILQFTKE